MGPVGNFELGVPGWYEVELSQTNDFLNQKLETDQYGKWYSVKFAGDATAHLWMTKTDPVVGEKYYGHIEMTTSGKSTKFKKDKVPEGETPAGASTNNYSADKDKSIHRSVALQQAVLYHTGADVTPEFVTETAEVFYAWLTGEAQEIKQTGSELFPDDPMGEV